METPVKSYDPVHRRILIVEDNDFNQKSFKTLLEQHGYETLLTKTGQEAIMLAQDELPDLILMDDQLPDGMSGAEVVRRLRDDERTKRIPIIAVFGFYDERTALDAGCDAYVAKPINPRNFPRMIESFLSKREPQNDDTSRLG
jgi:two-component system cell cycle response regulator DivK